MQKTIKTLAISAMLTVSLSADFLLQLTHSDGTQSSQCIKSYSFSNNLESLAKQKGVVNDVYSETEVVTNKMYKGKPVYRKIVNISGTHINDGAYHAVPYLSSYDGIEIMDINILKQDHQNSSFYVNERVKVTKLFLEKEYKYVIGKDNGAGEYNFDIVLEYTKTTDSVSTNNNEFKSYFHYVPSNTELGSLVSIDMKDVGVRFLEDYTYDSTTDSCNKN